MRATQSSRLRTNSLNRGGAISRQASLNEWNFSGNIQRFATIGLVSKTKNSVDGANYHLRTKTRSLLGKENSLAAADLSQESRMAAKR